MKKVVKLISLVLVVLLCLSLASVALAEGAEVAETTPDASEPAPEITEAAPDASEPVPDESELPAGETVTIPILDVDPGQEELVVGETEEMDISELPGASSDVDERISEVQSKVDQGAYEELDQVLNPYLRSGTYGAYYDTITDSISTEGTIQPYGVMKLGPNQILQAGLECPSNNLLDYDLYIAEVNPDNTVGTILTVSQMATYTDDTTPQTVDEGTDYINTSSETKSYCILVHAKKGSGSLDRYTVYFSIDASGNYNQGEEDQNPASPAGTLKYGNSASGVILNSPADVDWFALDATVGNAYEYADANIKVVDPTTNATLSSDKVTVYQHIGSNRMKVVQPTSGSTYRFTPDTSKAAYYVQVKPANRSNFDWHRYKISFDLVTAKAAATSITITALSTPKDPTGANGFVTWPTLGYAYCIDTSSWLTVEGTAKDAFGNLCQSGTPIKMTFYNQTWIDKANENLGRRVVEDSVGANGGFNITLDECPPAFGAYSASGSVYRHTYDIVTISVTGATDVGVSQQAYLRGISV
ncbi:hypothetical protein [Christensenella hongkongensis]|uniref:Uncharacterized protein n=1 Tax=Christensenella hongkongensis TaxID=270498 RepID=A0A0M2NBX7_9FIRM|nr:hypothetical protein [Christensenella hongkongensis]KKI49979.1 hypothetical protein CHK_2595 [Christensenella hongkongensis]TCW27921.1 hypothetical protein EV208_10983 [Christensenella hongkongensis]